MDELVFKQAEQNVVQEVRQEIDDLSDSIEKRRKEIEFLTQQLNIEVSKKLSKERNLRDLELAEAERKRQQKLLEEKEREQREALLALEMAKERLDNLELKAWPNARDYQQEDIITIFNSFMEEENGFVNANDMSLGKTFETIASLEAMMKSEGGKCLWLTKSQILKTNGTLREVRRWSDIPVTSVDGSMPAKQRDFTFEMIGKMDSNLIVITNYETVRTTFDQLVKCGFKYVVMDEVHKLKGGANPSGPTGLWSSVREFIWKDIPPLSKMQNYNPVSSVDYIMMLTGTPMVNRVAELWAYLHIFDPVRFDNLRAFERAYNAYVEAGGKIDTNRILEICLKDRMIRRTRSEVFDTATDDFPELIVMDREIEFLPEQQRVYDMMKEQFFIWLDEQDDNVLTAAAVIAQLIRLRQISVWPVFSQESTHPVTGETLINSVDVQESAKIDEAMDIIEDANDQVIVFCNFNEPFNEIQRRCNKIGLRCEMITGKVKDMSGLEVGFQNGEIDVLCINSSMGEGLNLQKNPDQWKGGARIGIHLDEWWNDTRDNQCDGRYQRPGAPGTCFSYRIVNPKAVDMYVRAISQEKSRAFAGIMDDGRIRPKEELKRLINGD